MSEVTCEEQATTPDSRKRNRPSGCSDFSLLRRCSSVTDGCGYASSPRLGEARNRQQRGMAECFNRFLSKTNQIFQFSSKIAMNTDIASKDNLVGDFEPYGCLLLASAGIHRSQIQIQPIENRIAVGWLAFFDDFAVQLLHQQRGRPPCENVSSREFLSRRPGSDQRDDFLLRQRRFAGENRLWRKQSSVKINAHGVIADHGCALQIDCRIR